MDTQTRPSARLYVLFVPAVVLLTIMLWGLGDLVWKSFHTFDAFTYTEGPASTQNYRDVWSADLTRTTLIRTVLMAATVTAVAVTVAIPYTYVIVTVSSRWLRLLLITATFVPVLTGDITRTFAWIIVFGRNGLIASTGDALGIDVPDMLGTPLAVGVSSLQILFPMAALLLLPAYQRVGPNLEEAAATLGARPLQRWRHIILPLLRPGIAAAVAVSFTVGMAEFASPALLGQGRFDYVSNLIQSIVLGRDNVYLGSALGIIVPWSCSSP